MYPIGCNAVHLRIFCLFYVQNKISQIVKNPAIARFFNYQKPLSIRISALSERHYAYSASFLYMLYMSEYQDDDPKIDKLSFSFI